jgi:isopenicillin-N N-acyltransferase-like protein
MTTPTVMTALPVLPLAGNALERGRAQGEALRPLIQTHVARWLDWLGRNSGEPPRAYVEALVTQTNFRPSIERWTPGLLEEVRGIAEGAGMDEALIFGLQLPDEEWWFRLDRRLAAGAQPGPVGEACSSVGVRPTDGHAAITAQNMDMPDYMDGLQVVLHLQPSDGTPEAYVFTVAGLIALNGLNRAGVSVCCNALTELAHAADGLPVAFGHRGILAQSSLGAAEAFVRGVRHASGQNFLLGGRERVVAYECSARAVVEVPADAARPNFCHTNHPLANGDAHRGAAEFDGLPENVRRNFMGSRDNSTARYCSVEDRLKLASGPLDVAAVQALLSAHDSPRDPVCRHKPANAGWMTIGSTVMTLGEPPRLHIAPGPPCSTGFQELSF